MDDDLEPRAFGGRGLVRGQILWVGGACVVAVGGDCLYRRGIKKGCELARDWEKQPEPRFQTTQMLPEHF